MLSPGQLISLDTVTLVVTDLDHAGDLYADLGDARAFGIILEQFRLIDATIRREGGALIKTVHEGTVSAFSDPAAAVRAALDLPGALLGGEKTRGLSLRIGVHRGSAMVATLNGHLDYFGTTVSVASGLPRLAGRRTTPLDPTGRLRPPGRGPPGGEEVGPLGRRGGGRRPGRSLRPPDRAVDDQGPTRRREPRDGDGLRSAAPVSDPEKS